ncbi:MAG: phenylalanine--tRNA ligase subunit beta [Candidatus Eisenbacteria bacterium]|uniref:phenylalanine--tRNA ligase n=1 Tax=Eiseniibacteriota bacterium TaxID=2212470 RepID=A0A956RQB2_UNCEI|nr:phenylalanine--tRNA ligase subunit beta [Candidatus Eisenbacteria bacterium]
MPVIGIPVQELQRRVGEELGRDRLLEVLGDLGCDVEGFAHLRRFRCTRCGFVIELVGKEEIPPTCDRCNAPLRDDPKATSELAPLEVVRMELLAVRPDMFDPAGLARAIRGVLGEETGLVEYPVGSPVMTLQVDNAVRRPDSRRPHIVCAVIENVHFDDDSIKLLMKLQENLHWALGRNRKHASIGVYDLDSLQGETDLVYTAEDPDDYAFTPLGAEPGSPPVGLRQILAEHPKGRAYAHLLESFDRYPILRTRSGLVLSMPPIINSEETRVHLDSHRLVIDVTGTGSRIVQRTLAILVTSLLEHHPEAQLRTVTIQNATPSDDAARIGDGNGSAASVLTTPDLSLQTMTVDPAATARILGLPLDGPRVAALLEKMRHRVTTDGARLKVEIAPYRNDILHERDLMEDAAIAFGYRNIPRTLVPTLTVGKEIESTVIGEKLREVMIGLGFLEVMTLSLTSPEQSDRLLGLPDHPATPILDNPISGEQTQLRTSLLPGLLTTLARNRHNALPQEIFELSEVTLRDPGAETGAAEHLQLALAAIAPKIGFAECRALLESIAAELGWPLRLEHADLPFLIAGRAAWMLAEDERVGIFGVLHPEVLERLGLQNPVIAAELTVPIAGHVQSLRSYPS